ncbi:MAG TPA: hypothetical protein VEZ24_12405 [Microvirga sp.]|nr:hypothetical protein [Microvirga sp.]
MWAQLGVLVPQRSKIRFDVLQLPPSIERGTIIPQYRDTAGA